MNPIPKKDANAPELESQLILRLPEEAAKVLRKALNTGANLKDRFSITIKNDVRRGEVKLDQWLFPVKVVDLPTITESLKTTDGKSFYKAADISQLVICKEEDDDSKEEGEEQGSDNIKKLPNKVDKKYLWPHGITPPTKNVRRRRFRKTLKNKYTEAPEIEKELKRLFRVDNEAVNVRWELISDDEKKVAKGVPEKEVTGTVKNACSDIERDIFGGTVSDSDDEDAAAINMLKIEDSSDSSDEDKSETDSEKPTEPPTDNLNEDQVESNLTDTNESEQEYNVHPDLHNYLKKMEEEQKEVLPKEEIYEKMKQLQTEINELQVRCNQQEMESINIENYFLRLRFQELLDDVYQEIREKDQEYQQLQDMLRIVYGEI